MMIGVLIMAALVLATGFLLFTAPEDPDRGAAITEPEPPPEEIETAPTPKPLPPPETPTIIPESPSPQPEVRSVTITYDGKKREDITEYVGNTVPLAVRVEPVGIQEEIIWESSDRSVFEVATTNPDGTTVTVTPIDKGTATLTVSVGGVEAKCIVRVRVR